MAELLLRAVGSYGNTDLVARFDDHTTIGQLADELELHFDRRGNAPRTIQRTSRGEMYFARTTRLSQANIRSGDTVSLALDTGLRASHGAPAAAGLRAISGPDAGRTFDLRRGESSIGRSSKCDVSLNDDMASRRHAIIRVSDIIEVADAGSTNGVLVNDAPVDGVVRLRAGDRLMVGDTTLVADLLGGTHEAVDVVASVIEFNRPPRIDRPFDGLKIDIPAPLEPPGKPKIPLISALVPLLMGGALFFFTRNIATVAFIALSPLMVFGNFWENKRSGRADYKERKAEHDATMNDQFAALDTARADEIRSRFRFAPDHGELTQCALDMSARLWEREPSATDFLDLRVGLLAQPSRLDINVAQGGKRDPRRALEEQVAFYRTLPPVPLTIAARTDTPVGVAGPSPQATDVARSLVLQAATLHSPSELVVGALVSEDNQQDWEWIKWLPHARVSPIEGELSAVGADEGITLIAALQDLIQTRLNADDSGGGLSGRRVFVPHVLFIVDDTIGIDRSRFSRLLNAGAEAGITIIWTAADARRLPNSCRTVIEVEPGVNALTVGNRETGLRFGGIPIEGVNRDAAEMVAQTLAPVVDSSAGATGATDLPKNVSLVEILGGVEILDSPAAILERWQHSSGARALRAPVGRYEGGTLSIDMRADGPHGLVGGTTGAGKSEFLQALIAGLAASHGPDKINILLVDYKGGTAFGELVDQLGPDGRTEWRGLHHTVGMITDLTPSLVRRALISLQAELHRRELILNHHRAKDLIEMEKAGHPDTPPSLLIVIDEFAALAKEVPEFVDGVVDIAQRGRSLGLHLLLATQKPGGVVTPNIQANTNLRVALRMASEDESSDVVNSPIAGHIDRSTPGRGVMRRGPSDLVAFQSAYLGGVTSAEAEATIELGSLALGSVQWRPPALADPSAGQQRPGETDIKRLVKLINTAAQSAGHKPPRRPWLDPLPDLVDLWQLGGTADDTRIPFGLADVPAHQTRRVAYFEPDKAGSLLIYGKGGSGKTVTLRTLAASFGLATNRARVHVYGLDFAGRGLEMLTPLPHVGTVIAGDDYERVTRLLANLKTEISRRADMFAAARASTLTEYRASSSHPGVAELARLVVLLDGYDNFLATYERVDRGQWADLVPRLVADGRAVGIHFVMTGTRRTSFPMAVASHVSSRLVFNMASPDDFHGVDVDPRTFDTDSPAGRCRFDDEDVQAAILGSDSATRAEAGEYQRLGAALAKRISPAPPIRVLPEQITVSQMPVTQSIPWLLNDDFAAIGPSGTDNFLIIGRPRSGRTTALRSLIATLATKGVTGDIFASDPTPFGPTAQPLDGLTARLNDAQSGLIFIDGAERLAAVGCEYALQQAVEADTLTVIATFDAATARGYDPWIKSLRARSQTLVLQPDIDADGDLLGSPLPRSARTFGPGRGFTNLRGSLEIVQVAT